MTVLSPLRTAFLCHVLAAEGIVEDAPNRGPEINAWLRFVGLSPGEPYCMAFVSYKGRHAADEIGVEWPLPLVGRVAYALTAAKRHGLYQPITSSAAPLPGDLWCYARGGQSPETGGNGHIAVVLEDGCGLSANFMDGVRRHAPEPGQALYRVGWICIEA